MSTKVISQQTGEITIDPCERLVLDRCVDLVVKGLVTVSGVSVIDEKAPLVSLHNCERVTFEALKIKGKVDQSFKSTWKRHVPNGLQLISSSIWIKQLDISYVHDGVINRGELNNITSLTVHHFSGDAVVACADNFQIDYCDLSVPLAVFPYDVKHPDFIQLYQLDKSKQIDGVPILKNNRFLGGKLLARNTGGEKWEHGIQGIGGFDGIYEDIVVDGFDIQTDIEQHGISFGCLRNSAITNNRVSRATGDFDFSPPLIRVGDRKLGLQSFGNTIENNMAFFDLPDSALEQRESDMQEQLTESQLRTAALILNGRGDLNGMSSPPRSGLSTRDLQRLLTICGYVLVIDGDKGRHTKTAMDHFSKHHPSSDFDSELQRVTISLLPNAFSDDARSLMIAVIAQCKNYGFDQVEFAAYVMATIDHETGGELLPVRESPRASDRWRKKHFRYFPYYGRGYVQLTWDYNYRKYQQILNLPLLNDLDIALNPEVSLFITVHGMVTGSFTGMRLDRYINANKVDYYNARRVVNGIKHTNRVVAKAKQWEDKIREYLG